MSLSNVFFETKILWSQIDSNQHLRHSAYADLGAQARIEILNASGITADIFKELHIGPILFREELIYFREIHADDSVKVTCELVRCRADGSRWSFRQEIYRSDGVKAAQINTDGAWLDTKQRKLAIPPAEIISGFESLPRSHDFTDQI
ncbi:MAG: acyl-CoA thioesterase [Bacteroidia bacterium]